MENFKETYERIMNETERKSIRETELISKGIIKELELYFNIHFSVENCGITYTSLIQMILLDPQYREYCEVLLYLMQNFKYNEQNLLFRFISILNQPSLNKQSNQYQKKVLEDSFSKLPSINDMEVLEIGYHINTDYGDVRVFQLDKILGNIEIPLQGLCHEMVNLYYKEFINDMITTSTMSNLFSGRYYHSYYSLEDGGVVDIANNTFYHPNDFQKIFSPIVVNQIPCNKIEEYYEAFKKENTCIPNKNRVLQMAIAKINHK